MRSFVTAVRSETSSLHYSSELLCAAQSRSPLLIKSLSSSPEGEPGEGDEYCDSVTEGDGVGDGVGSNGFLTL